MNELTNTNQRTPIYFTTPIFKNILEFCGEPLPNDLDYCDGYNSSMTRKYYRNKDGSISYRVYQKIVMCKKCKEQYYNTGYPFCRGCYKDFSKVSLYPIKKGICLMESDSDSD